MKSNHMKAQTISLMVVAMHKYIQRLSADPIFNASDAIKQRLRATENSFYHLSKVADDLNSKSLQLNFKKAA